MTPKKGQDWHPADVKAALEKAGWSLRRLSAHHGYSSSSMAHALKPAETSSRVELRIAEALGIAPHEIWPSRYNADGTRIQKIKTNPNWGPRIPEQSSQDTPVCHVKDRRAA